MHRKSNFLFFVSLIWLQAVTAGRICPEDKRLCSSEISTLCYDPATEICWGGAVCKIGEKACGFTCYNPNDSVCYSGGALCKIGQTGCGRDCYDPNDSGKKCIDYGWGDILCNANQTNCQHGFGEMYCCDEAE